jgi:hypothetical protein
MKENKQGNNKILPHDKKINIHSMEIPPETPPKVNPTIPKK